MIFDFGDKWSTRLEIAARPPWDDFTPVTLIPTDGPQVETTLGKVIKNTNGYAAQLLDEALDDMGVD